VVKAFAPDRADQPLDVSVFPRRARGDWVIADTHRMDAPSVRGAERIVAVAQQMPNPRRAEQSLGGEELFADAPWDLSWSHTVCSAYMASNR
jgi:hypothetical protein